MRSSRMRASLDLPQASLHAAALALSEPTTQRLFIAESLALLNKRTS